MFECFEKYRVMRDHKEIADSVLMEFMSEAERLGLFAYVRYGTCLGFVRDGGYIEFDNDIDLGVQCGREDWDRFLAALRKRGFIFADNDYGGHFVKDRIMLDVTRTDGAKHPHETQLFSTVKYEGKAFFVPAPVNDYLTANYGDWRTRRLKGKYDVYRRYGEHVADKRRAKRLNWERHADVWKDNKSHYEESLQPFQIEEREQFLTELSDTSILDVGCGTGADMQYFSDKGKNCVGVDFSRNMMGNDNVVVGTGVNLPFADGAFDGVWCNSMLKHLPRTDLFRCLAEIRRVLKEGGVFWAGLDEGEGSVTEDGVTFNLYSEEQFTRYVEYLKFEVLQVTRVSAWRNFISFLVKKK